MLYKYVVPKNIFQFKRWLLGISLYMYGLELSFLFSFVINVIVGSQMFVEWTHWVLKVKQKLF